MKKINIVLHKTRLFEKLESITWKRADASLAERTEREQSATTADTEAEKVDALLLDDYCNRRDARIRARLKFCLIEETGDEITFDNTIQSDPEFKYVLNLDDDITKSDVQAIGTLIEEYILRGASFDWYLHMGYDPLDSEIALKEIEDSVASVVRGKSWGARPLQPFGPALYDFNKLF